MNTRNKKIAYAVIVVFLLGLWLFAWNDIAGDSQALAVARVFDPTPTPGRSLLGMLIVAGVAGVLMFWRELFSSDRASVTFEAASMATQENVEAQKYVSGQRVILLEARPEDGYSVCIVKSAFYFAGRWQYDVEIVESTHYGPQAVGEGYRGAPEWRLCLPGSGILSDAGRWVE